MRSALFFTITLFFIFSMMPTQGFAELSEEGEKCQSALDDASKEVARRRDADAAVLNTSSAATPPTNASADPLAQLVSSISEKNVKAAELAKQQMEQERQINTEQFKQIGQIEDQERAINKEKSKLPIEISNARLELKKQEQEMRVRCSERANKEYAELVAGNSALASRSQYTVSSLSQMSGTRTRMRSFKKYYFERCLAEPTTREAFQLAADELDTKLYNFSIQSGIYNADLAYTQSKIPKLVAHMDEQRNYVAQTADIQMNTLQQTQQMQLMQLGMALSTSAAAGNEKLTAAGTFRSADQTLTQFDEVRKICANDVYGNKSFYEVPSDMIDFFSKVNRVCRPKSTDNPSLTCVRSSGQPSSVPRNSATGVGV